MLKYGMLRNDVCAIGTLPVFSSPNIEKTADFYCNILGFKRRDYVQKNPSRICLYRGDASLILVQSRKREVVSCHEVCGYGYDAYFLSEEPSQFQIEFKKKGVKVVRNLTFSYYATHDEFVLEDIDGRWIAFGFKRMQRGKRA